MEQMSSCGSSVSGHALTTGLVLENNAERESVSESGDIGDRVLHSQRLSESGSPHFSFDPTPEKGQIQAYPAAASNPISCMKSSAHIMTALSTNGKESVKELPQILNYVSCLVHLAVFGILGVLTRYLLQKLFGPKVADVTSDQTILYLDLPSNMVGSFLMGWFGVVFKADISHVSEHLAIALTTGYLGSLTTFSGWNQKMLELGVAGHWFLSVLGFLVGLFLVAFSIIFGIETAKGFRWLLRRPKTKTSAGSCTCGSNINWKLDSYILRLIVMIVLLVILSLFLGVSCAILKAKFKHGGDAAQLWLACIVGPLGVWIRWFLARLNGCGIGREEFLKWVPFGTLIANVSAAWVVAALATLKKSVNTRNCDTIAVGIQFGLLGCLSTVSTFAAEFNAMRESKHPWRAYAYAMITITPSFCLGILIYCIPVWRT